MHARKFLNGPVGLVLHPGTQSIQTVHLALRVGIELVEAFGDGGTGVELVCHAALFGVDGGQLFQAPGVGFVEVDLGSQELAREQGVVVATAGVGFGGQGSDDVAEEVSQGVIGFSRAVSGCADLFCQGFRGGVGCLLGEAVKAAVGLCMVAALFDDALDLTQRRRPAVVSGLAQCVSVLGECPGHLR